MNYREPNCVKIAALPVSRAVDLIKDRRATRKLGETKELQSV